MAAKPKDVDRKALELEYRAGIKSLRALGSEFGISGARVLQIAEELGWERDLKARIQAATAAKLNAAILDVKLDTDKVEREERVVEANADTQVDVILSTRTDIQRVLNLVYNLLSELEETTNNRDLFDQLGVLMNAPDEKGIDKLNETYRKTISLPSRVSAMKSLTDSLKTLIGLKRQAYGLSDNANGDSDKPQEKTEMTPQEEARRIAFVLASAIHRKGE